MRESSSPQAVFHKQSGTHGTWEEVENCINSVLQGKEWVNILLCSSATKWEGTDKLFPEGHSNSLRVNGHKLQQGEFWTR